MLSLISTSERVDLVITTDPAVKMSKKDRKPARAILKKDAKLNGATPFVLTVRPLDSLEMSKLMTAGAAEAGTFESMIESVAAASIKATGEGFGLPWNEPTVEQIKTIPPAELAALANFVLNASIGADDPT